MRIATEIGLTETELRKRGGGLVWFVVFAVAVIIVLVTPEPISVESDLPQPNPALSVPKAAADDADAYLKK